jgi:hypothetical protein
MPRSGSAWAAGLRDLGGRWGGSAGIARGAAPGPLGVVGERGGRDVPRTDRGEADHRDRPPAPQQKSASLRPCCLPERPAACLFGLPADVAAPGTILNTDGWCGPEGIAESGYGHQATAVSSCPVPVEAIVASVCCSLEAPRRTRFAIASRSGQIPGEPRGLERAAPSSVEEEDPLS